MEKMKELVAPVEKEVLAVPELDTAFLVLGASRQPPYKGSMGVKLVPSSERKRSMAQIQDELRGRLRNITGLKVAVQTGQNTTRGDARPLQLALRGPELTQLTQYAMTLADNIKTLPGTADVDYSSEQYGPEIVIKFDPARYVIRSASYPNWPAVAMAAPGNIIPDFPLINKSFELCYACLDR